MSLTVTRLIYVSAQVRRLCVLAQDVEVRDRLTISDVNKLLYQYQSELLPKQQHTSMVSVKAVTERPDLSKPTVQETKVRVSLQPLRINIDQVTISVSHAHSLHQYTPTHPNATDTITQTLKNNERDK